MIVKVKGYKSMAAARNLIAYAMDDRKRIFDKKGRSFVLTNNLKGQTIEEWTLEFKENETYRIHKRKNNVKITQEIIAFHRGDAKMLTIKKMEKMAREYMRLRNPNAMYVAVPHFDKEHPHIHIVSSAVEYHTGKSLCMSREQFLQLKKDIQAYQVERYPELARSVVRHGRKRKVRATDREYQYKLRTGRQTKREEVIALVRHCTSQTSTEMEFITLLKKYQLQPYDRGGKVTGVIHAGKKYRFKRLGVGVEHVQLKEQKRDKRTTQVRNNGKEQRQILEL